MAINLNNIYFENNQTIQYIKHSNYIQDSETSNSVNCYILTQGYGTMLKRHFPRRFITDLNQTVHE